MAPFLSAPTGFGSAVQLTVPTPKPEEPDVMCSQVTPGPTDALHELQKMPPVGVTEILSAPVKAWLPMAKAVGVTVKVQVVWPNAGAATKSLIVFMLARHPHVRASWHAFRISTEPGVSP